MAKCNLGPQIIHSFLRVTTIYLYIILLLNIIIHVEVSHSSLSICLNSLISKSYEINDLSSIKWKVFFKIHNGKDNNLKKNFPMVTNFSPWVHVIASESLSMSIYTNGLKKANQTQANGLLSLGQNKSGQFSDISKSVLI